MGQTQRIAIDPEAYEDKREWVQLAIMMVNDGFTAPEVGEMLGHSPNTIYNALHPSDRRRHRRNRPGPRSICTRCGEAMSYLSRRAEPVCKRCESGHARRHDEEISRLWQESWKSDEIAEHLGDMTSLAVNHRVNSLRHQGVALERRVRRT